MNFNEIAAISCACAFPIVMYKALVAQTAKSGRIWGIGGLIAGVLMTVFAQKEVRDRNDAIDLLVSGSPAKAEALATYSSCMTQHQTLWFTSKDAKGVCEQLAVAKASQLYGIVDTDSLTEVINRYELTR